MVRFTRSDLIAKPFLKLFLLWLGFCLVVGGVAAADSELFGRACRISEAWRLDAWCYLAEPFFWRQDLAVIVAAALAPLFIGLARFRLERWPGRAAVVVLALGCVAATWAGISLVYHGYALSMDEFLATFDAAIYGEGDLAATIPERWRGYLYSLQPMFVLQYPQGGHWVSNYLPVNAAIRASAMQANLASLVNPLWTGVSVLAVYGIGRRLWPDEPARAFVAVALLATSSQVLVMATTTYAMPALLALNLVWLWLFLRGGVLGHAAAAGVGLAATGVHQLLFHPLFAAPFFLQLLLEKRWRPLIFYGVSYAAIGGFWVSYPALARDLAGITPEPDLEAAGSSLWGTVSALVGNFDIDGVGLMAKNLVRFATWQNPLMLPLLLLALGPALWRGGAVRSLALGILLTLAAVFVLMPMQGHGWGYRYLHGLLGSACLLGAWSWDRQLSRLSPDLAARARAGFALAAVLSLVVLLPVRAWQASRFVAPYAASTAAIDAATSDVVLVDDSGVWYGIDLVRNDPYLRQRPIVLDLPSLTETGVRALCANYSVSVYDVVSAKAFGIPTFPPWALSRAVNAARMRGVMKEIGCGQQTIGRGAAQYPAR